MRPFKRIKPAVINGCGLTTLYFLICFHAVAGTSVATDRLICCGQDEVFILDLSQKKPEKLSPVWSWKAEDSPGIPENGRKSFASTDECKPVGNFLIITSSSGGVAVIQRNDKSCHFYTQAKNAHSACLLPNYRVAVASSFGGDELLIYDLAKPNGQPAKSIAKMELRGAHGAVWDEQLERLWALGSDELLLVKIEGGSKVVKLQVEKRIQLPTPGGHDLSRSHSTGDLFVTTNNNVYLFDPDTSKFKKAEPIADKAKVKSVSAHPQTHEVVYHQGTAETWWSDTIRFVGQREEIQLPGRRLYKVRWDK